MHPLLLALVAAALANDACGPPADLERAAMLGALSDAQQACLLEQLASEPQPDPVYRLLRVDASSRGDRCAFLVLSAALAEASEHEAVRALRGSDSGGNAQDLFGSDGLFGFDDQCSRAVLGSNSEAET